MEVIVVGGVAAVIHGAPITTQDLDIVPRLDEGDPERLLALLALLEARFRPVVPGRDIAPARSHLDSQGRLNLITRHGPIDILCRLHDERGYHELIERSRTVSDGSLRVRVLDLDALIDIERSTGRQRDKLVVPILVALRDRVRVP